MGRKWSLAWLFLAVVGPVTLWAGQEDPVVARIGDQAITMSTVEEEYEGTPQAYGGRQRGNSQMLLRSVKHIVERKVRALSAVQKGLDQDPKIKARIRIYTETLLADAYTEALKAEIKASTTMDEAEVKRYFERHQKRFTNEGKIRLQYMAFKKQNEAERVLARLKKAAVFSELARKHSIHPSGHGGGYLAWIEYGQVTGLEPAIAGAVPDLDVGSTSGVLQLRDGYCIVKVADRQPAAPVPLADVSEKIERIIRKKKERKAMETALEEQMKAMNVQIMVEAPGGKPPPPR